VNPSILQALKAAGRKRRVEPYFVGGPVRDRLLGRVCHDWDIVSRQALPLARSVVKSLRGKLITLDDQNRIYRIILTDHTTIDFAEMQGKNIREDLARRDFTINAMAQRLEGRDIIDPFNGQKDLNRSIIRGLGLRAFREDPLRLVRAFRFAAQFGFSIEPGTLKWIIQGQSWLIGRVAYERIREEWLRNPAADGYDGFAETHG
jgi:tRNA nucleotidyltransferase (CCA-adding enzyme)